MSGYQLIQDNFDYNDKVSNLKNPYFLLIQSLVITNLRFEQCRAHWFVDIHRKHRLTFLATEDDRP
jgi:hypothetical protein